MSAFQPARVPSAGPGIPVGISSCLLGGEVRFDGGHKRSDFCTGELAAWFDYVPVCPEIGIGLGTPREAIQLRRDGEGRVRLVGNRTGTDHTDAMSAYARDKAAELSGLCGYIVTKRSPTCGLERIKVHHDNGMPDRGDQSGVYTRVFMAANPLIPVEEDGRLNDVHLRENFVTRVFVLWRWRQLRAQGLTPQRLIDFHSDHKYLLMAHSVPAYRALGRELAHLAGRDLETVADTYIAGLMAGLARPVTRRGHANVLQHILGYFRPHLPGAHRQRLAALIDDYRRGLVPLSAPLALVNHFLADFPDPYLSRQVYLDPHPSTLKLRAFL